MAERVNRGRKTSGASRRATTRAPLAAAWGALCGELAHEVRSPLSTLLLWLRLLRDPRAKVDLAAALVAMESSAREIATIVEQLVSDAPHPGAPGEAPSKRRAKIKTGTKAMKNGETRASPRTKPRARTPRPPD